MGIFWKIDNPTKTQEPTHTFKLILLYQKKPNIFQTFILVGLSLFF